MSGLNKAEEYYKSAVAFYNSGDFDSALAEFLKVLEYAPNHSATCNLIGLIFLEKKEITEAIRYFQSAIAGNPGNPMYYVNLGRALKENGEVEAALKYFEKAIQLDPENDVLYNGMGLTLNALGRIDQAIENFQTAIRLNPVNPFYYNNYALALQEKGDYRQAAEKYRQAINLKPDYAIFYTNAGVAYEEWAKPEEALHCYQKAVELKPANPYFRSNLAGGYMETGDYKSALDSYLYALNLDPENPDLNYNISLLYLLLGNFQEGWRPNGCFGYRRERSEALTKLLQKPEWQGEDLKGQRIYIYSDQGFGDTIQFIRYLPALKEKGAFVIFGCHPSLVRLLQNCAGFDLITDKAVGRSELDYHFSLLRLPAVLKIGFGSMMVPVPYIKVPELLNQTWKEELGRIPGIKAGIAWEPGAKSKTRYKRRFPLENFYELAKIPGLILFSLQKGETAGQLPEGSPIISLTGKLADFADTAAIINNLDLVITIDTAIAHLAGALNKPVWLLLPFSPDWRWFLNRDDSPWYPSMKLFRQDRPGNWESVLEKVKAELIKNFFTP
jgi:Flp pilus assembly protein TadD